MIGIHPVHRRLADLVLKARRLGGLGRLSYPEIIEINQCLEVNANLVQKLDGLKEIAFIAHQAGDMEWQQEICRQIDELEAKCI